MTDLTVITVVENDNGIFDLMIKSVLKFTNPHPNIIICNNKANNPILDKYKNKSNITIINNAPKLSGGSNRHGSGLNAAIANVVTAKTAIIESDCVLTDYSWHDLEGKDMLAAVKVRTNVPFYHIAFTVFYTDVLNGMDFGPDSPQNRVSGRSYPPHRDVGWRINDYVKEEDIAKLEFIDCKTGKGQILGSKFQSDEFWKNGKPVVVHFGRGSNMGGKANRKGFPTNTEQLEKFKLILEEKLK
jgi:hypothetical protein